MFACLSTLIFLLSFVAAGHSFPVPAAEVIQNTQRVTGGLISMELYLNELASKSEVNRTYLLGTGPVRGCYVITPKLTVQPFISILLGCFPVDGNINTEFPCANMTAIITRSTDAAYFEKHLLDKFSPNLWILDYEGRKYYTVGWGNEHIYVLAGEQYDVNIKIKLNFELIDCADM